MLDAPISEYLNNAMTAAIVGLESIHYMAEWIKPMMPVLAPPWLATAVAALSTLTFTVLSAVFGWTRVVPMVGRVLMKTGYRIMRAWTWANAAGRSVVCGAKVMLSRRLKKIVSRLDTN